MHACWLLLDADQSPSAIMTPFTAAGPSHTRTENMSQLDTAWHVVVRGLFKFQWLTCMVCLLACVVGIAHDIFKQYMVPWPH